MTVKEDEPMTSARHVTFGRVAFAMALLAACGAPGAFATDSAPVRGGSQHWVGTWAAPPQLVTEAQRPPSPPGFADTTLRQLVHVSLGGKEIRVRFSNAFGAAPLTVVSAHVALAAGGSAIREETDKPLTFQGQASVTIPEGALIVSDPLAFDLPALANVAITIYLRGVPDSVTIHPGSRTTSYLQAGDHVSSRDLVEPAHIDHWYFVNGIDVVAGPQAAAIAVLGDSITDGRGSTTNGNDRWTDELARRLQGGKGTEQVAVLNQGIGGNRLLRDGLGPNALARLDRDVLAQPGVRWLIVLEGINDIGTRLGARKSGAPFASAEDIIAAYEQIIVRCRAHGIRVYGATIMPFEGADFYFTSDGEADRQRINDWIRTSGRFDAVIDFDAITRDPQRPSRLSAAVDGGDHLHPSAAGYEIMAEAIDLSLFADRSGGR
jgi:lysophospholipase L1-like esterase